MEQAFNKTIEEFDAFADAILKGGDVDGDTIIATDNTQIASNVREVDQLHNDKFQPAFIAMKDAGRKLIEAKLAADKAMGDLESEFDQAVESADAFEILVAAEIETRMAAAQSAEDAKKVLAEEVPLSDCAMEIKVQLGLTRIPLEEVAQATTEQEVTECLSEYEEAINAVDNVVTSVLNGGEVGGTTVVATDNDRISAQVKVLDAEHEDFQKAAIAMIRAQGDMIAKAKLANEAMAQMDKVTQQNAANAEEAASASEELSAQAEQMNSIVDELAVLVGGSALNTTVASTAGPRPSKQHQLSRSDHVFHHVANGGSKRTKTKVAAKATAEKMIPLSDNDCDDLREFNS